MLKMLIPVLILLVSHCSIGHARSYTIGIVEWEPWATAWVAHEKGFWQQEGIKVEVKQFNEYENGSIKAFKFGELDFAMMMLGNGVELINTIPRYIILHEHNWSHGGDYLIVDKSIDEIRDLKGKKIGLYSHSLPIEFFVEKILRKGGLTSKDVNFYEVSNTKKLNAALSKGTFSAIVNYGADALQVIQAGTGRKLYSSADFPGVIPEGIVAQRRLLEESPEDVKKFLRGWMQAVRWQSNSANTEEYHAILKRTMFKGSNVDSNTLSLLSQGRRIHLHLQDIRRRDSQDAPLFIQDLLHYLSDKGQYGRLMEVDNYLQTGMAIKAAEDVWQENSL